MGVQKWDFFAVKHYPFTLNKATSFFTLPTILLSLLIVFLSIYVNMDTICHLWLSRQQLPITLAHTLSYPSELTSTRLCYRPRIANAILPAWRVLDTSLNPIDVPFVSSAQVLKENPGLQSQLGHKFGCLDVSGIQFSEQNKFLYIQVQGNATLFIQMRSSDQIIWQKPSRFIELQPGYSRVVRILHASVKDSLSLNTDPQKITTFNLDEQTFLTRFYNFPFQSNHSKFCIQLFVPSVSNLGDGFQINQMVLTITRNDLGTIIGSVISTVSSLVLVCGVVVLPIMSKYQILVQVKSLFYIERRFAHPSLSRFIVASFRKGVFPKEDHYVMLSQQLQRIKDISYSIKICKTLRKIRSKLPPKVQTENMANQESFGVNSQGKEVGLEYYSEERQQVGNFDTSDERPIQKSIVVTVKTALLNWLDSGSDTITMNYYGNGHGTGTSIGISLLFLTGFAAFLYLFNFLSFQTTVTSLQLTEPEGYSYTFAQNELILATRSTIIPIISLMDGELNTISLLTPIQGPQCLANLTSTQIQQARARGQNTFFYCFQGGLSLQHSSHDRERVALYIDNSNQASIYTMFHFSQPSPTTHYRPIDPSALILPLFDPSTTVYPTIEVTVTQIVNQDAEEGLLAHFNPLQQKGNELNSLTGLYISLQPKKQLITISQPSLFDLVQNIWSLGSICFTVILLKIARYINLRQKQKAVHPVRAEHRENLGILLSKVNKLLTGQKGAELRRAGFYLKEELA